jgi:hypothetical protein
MVRRGLIVVEFPLLPDCRKGSDKKLREHRVEFFQAVSRCNPNLFA